LKKYSESLHYFEKALTVNADDDWALVRRTKTYCYFQKYDEALAGLGRSLGFVTLLFFKTERVLPSPIGASQTTDRRYSTGLMFSKSLEDMKKLFKI